MKGQKERQWENDPSLQKNVINPNCSFMLVLLTSGLTAVSHLREYFSESLWPLYWHCYKRIPQRIAVLWAIRHPSPHKKAKNHREVWMAGPLWWTMLVHWWDRGQSQLNHHLYFSSSWQQMKPRQMAWTYPSEKTTGRGRTARRSQRRCFSCSKAGVNIHPSQVHVKRQSAFQLKYYSATRLSVWDISDLSLQTKSWDQSEDICSFLSVLISVYCL